MYREKQQRIEVSLLTFLLHLKNHSEESERHVNHLQEHINWQKVRSKVVLGLALKNNMIHIDNDIISGLDLIKIKKASTEEDKSQIDVIFELELASEEQILDILIKENDFKQLFSFFYKKYFLI